MGLVTPRIQFTIVIRNTAISTLLTIVIVSVVGADYVCDDSNFSDSVLCAPRLPHRSALAVFLRHLNVSTALSSGARNNWQLRRAPSDSAQLLEIQYSPLAAVKFYASQDNE